MCIPDMMHMLLHVESECNVHDITRGRMWRIMKALNITFVSWVEVSELAQRRDQNTIVDATFTNLIFEFIGVFFHSANWFVVVALYLLPESLFL